MSTTTTPLSPRLIGQTEKAMNAILDRLLAGTGLTEGQWVALTLTVGSAGALTRDQLVQQLTEDVKIDSDEAAARLEALTAGGLIDAPGEDDARTAATPAGLELHRQVRAGTAAVVDRLWGDMPHAELATTARVLHAVLARANAELSPA